MATTLMLRLIAYAFLAFISSKGLLAINYLTPGCVAGGVDLGSETSSGDGAREKMSAKPGELEGRNSKEKNNISRMKTCSAKNEGGDLLSREKLQAKCEAIFNYFSGG